MPRIDRITVLMTAYNAMPYLVPAVQSILAQTYGDFEFLIVDDGSTDDSPAYLESLDDPRVRLIRLPQNQGRGAALNLALKEAQGDWIALMDADDVSLPTRLEKEVAFLNSHPEYAYVSCGVRYIGINGQPLKATYIPPLASPPTYQPLFDPAIANPGSLFKRQAALAVGGYRNFLAAADLDLWIRLDEAGYRIASLPEILVYYRVLPTSISSHKFIEQRLHTRYFRECSLARRAGQPEPDYQEFLKQHWPRGWARWQVEGARQFRLAGATWGARRYLEAAGRLLLSSALDPCYVFRKLQTLLRGELNGRLQGGTENFLALSAVAALLQIWGG